MSPLRLLSFGVLLAFFDSSSALAGCEPHLVVNPARERAEAVVRGARHVTIDNSRIEAVARRLAEARILFKVPTWDFPPYPGKEAPFSQMFRFFLIEDSIMYRFFFRHGHEEYSDGADRGAGLLVKRIGENWSLLRSNRYLQEMTPERISNLVFRAEVPLPDPSSRAAALREVGDFFARHKGVDWLAWLKRFSSPVEVATYLATQMRCYHDPYLKRAQLFIGTLIARYKTDLPPALQDPEGLTVYADYILPMVLRSMGILVYEQSLAKSIDKLVPIISGSPEEEEIRASTIVAFDRLLAALRRFEGYRDVNLLGLDAAFWGLGNEIAVEGPVMPPDLFLAPLAPYHRVFGLHY